MRSYLIEIARLLLGLVVLFVSLAAADPQEDWRDRWMVELVEMETRSTQEKFERLGVAVRARSSKGGELPTENQLAVGNRAADMLMTTPGHAEYYGRKIRMIMDEEVAKTAAADPRQRTWTFETLEQLPSPETVNVLGELLSDERDPYKGINHGDTGTPIPNFKQASIALTRLGIREAPVKNTLRGSSGFELSEVEKWKVWYEEVKDGTRTFSFESDDAIYSLAGRVATGRDGPVRSRPERQPPSASRRIQDDGFEKRNWTPSIVAGVWLVGIVILTVRRLKRRASGTQ